MLRFINIILFKIKVYEEWKTKIKLTHLKIIFIKCFIWRKRILVPKMDFFVNDFYKKIKDLKYYVKDEFPNPTLFLFLLLLI